jgi:hypothetical protein
MMDQAAFARRRILFGQRRLVVKSLLAVFALGLAAASATYAPPAWAQTGQQELLRRDCDPAAESKKLTGAAQKSYIEDCLSGKEAVASVPSPQQRFRSCALKAGDQKLSGDKRQAFIKNCLKD